MLKPFGDTLLVVQQVSKVCQCYNGSLNAYLDKCLDVISSFDEFIMKHIPRELHLGPQQGGGEAVTWVQRVGDADPSGRWRVPSLRRAPAPSGRRRPPWIRRG